MLYSPSSRAHTLVMLSSAALDEPYETCPLTATRLAWLETLTMEPPRPAAIMEREAYLITSRLPRALMLITLSKTLMSVSWGEAISPPQPPQFTTPHSSRPSTASRTLSSEVRSKGRGRAPVADATCSSFSTDLPPAITSAPCLIRRCTVAPPIPPLAPVTRMVRPAKSFMMLPRSLGVECRPRLARPYRTRARADAEPGCG